MFTFFTRVARAVRGTTMRLTRTPGWVEGTLLALLWALVLVRLWAESR